ncbi:MAG: dockerin type I repeat-containing protein [Bacteroidaceae bacterium]|nr:dockerin type I repeat-containing protein [Bacteroidaceae bacterium]
MKTLTTLLLALAMTAIGQAKLPAETDSISEQNPLDATQYINNPDFEVNSTNGWDVSNMQSQTNSSFTKKHGGTYVEKWTSQGNAVGNGSVSQLLKGLPLGLYRLTVAAQNLSQNNTTKRNRGASIYAGEAQTPVYTPKDYSVDFICISGHVEIGFLAVSAQGNWIAVDNFRLYQIGQVSDSIVRQTLSNLVDEANRLLQSKISTNTYQPLREKTYAANRYLESDSVEYSPDIAYELQEAIAAAKVSESEYITLSDKVASTQAVYDPEKQGADDLLAVIDQALELMSSGELTSENLATTLLALDKAILAFQLANATPGTGTAPQVSYTNHYVATGSTQALVRATSSGANVLERGVCWSTSHNPTVLDERTTKSFSLNGTIYHIKGLQPATVYYVRPYIMNKTYTVAYGDEVKIVTHPKGTCTGSWNEGAPTEEANARCRNAIKETIEYFNEWTGIRGFHLTGNYGAGTQTADCSYGGWMRIGPNAGNQAIGTVLHETGHGVGVGTQDRWWDTNVHDWVWKGRETTDVYHFLENQYNNPDYVFVGDRQHGWGQNASYDWLVNGADKDKHQELQYIGGMCILHGLFIDGLCPTSNDLNGISGYTYNFDDSTKYYLMNKDAERGLGDGLLFQRNNSSVSWKPLLQNEQVSDSAAWYIEFNAQRGYYLFRNALTGRYLTHSATGSMVTMKSTKSPSTTELFQLMPDRTDVTLSGNDTQLTTHGYWFTWVGTGTDNKPINKAMGANVFGSRTGYGSIPQVAFDYSDNATQQQWIIISQNELETYQKILGVEHHEPETKKGDLDGDGKLTVEDIVLLIEIYLNPTSEPVEPINDIDGDGQLSVNDIAQLIELYLNENGEPQNGEEE